LEAAEEESVALEARLGETGRDWESHHELETAQRNRAAVQGEVRGAALRADMSVKSDRVIASILMECSGTSIVLTRTYS
jgi:hypothetical protein